MMTSSVPGGANTPGPARLSLRPPRRQGFGLPLSIIALVIFMGLSSGWGFVTALSQQSRLTEYQAETAQVQSLQLGLVDAERGVRGYVLTGERDYLDPYVAGMRVVSGEDPEILRTLDDFSRSVGAGNPARPSFLPTLADLRSSWSAAIRLVQGGEREEAEGALTTLYSKALMDRLRGYIDEFVGRNLASMRKVERRLYTTRLWLLLIALAGTLIAVSAMVYAFRRSAFEARGRELAIAEGVAARQQVEQLFMMADMLQSAADQDDTNAVLRTTAMRLLPGFSGALYVFNNSRDRLTLSTSWGDVDSEGLAEYITPDSCWALKRGKPYMNGAGEHALCCTHSRPGVALLEIPMAARGQLHGMLQLSTQGEDTETRLAAIQPIASAIGDAMSLALASMALRERLRNQALRDALTGLYNRHFLEEALERMCLDAERRKTSIAAIMIDIDHFKRLNDQHGHAAGDVALQDISNTILSCLHRTDMACRYGGEELAILLPDCSLAAAEAKAEEIRGRIADMRTGEGLSVTASLGVAAIPETTIRAGDLLSSADAALYQAKQEGRNRVVLASPRSARQRLNLVETGS
jgi:diguanylate cyclase (GGDEF)-like protein